MASNEARPSALDELYGPAAPAGGRGIQQHEFGIQPRSRQKLDAESGPALRAYLERVSELRLANVFPEVYAVLWIVDEDGDLWFAVEEVVDAQGNLIGVFPKETQAQPLSYFKLGHPTLVGAESKLARIGGEVVFDPDDPKGSGHKFCVTNDSGRYGARPGQREEHLAAVTGKFADNGLYFWSFFQKPSVR